MVSKKYVWNLRDYNKTVLTVADKDYLLRLIDDQIENVRNFGAKKNVRELHRLEKLSGKVSKM